MIYTGKGVSKRENRGWDFWQKNKIRKKIWKFSEVYDLVNVNTVSKKKEKPEMASAIFFQGGDMGKRALCIKLKPVIQEISVFGNLLLANIFNFTSPWVKLLIN